MPVILIIRIRLGRRTVPAHKDYPHRLCDAFKLLFGKEAVFKIGNDPNTAGLIVGAERRAGEGGLGPILVHEPRDELLAHERSARGFRHDLPRRRFSKSNRHGEAARVLEFREGRVHTVGHAPVIRQVIVINELLVLVRPYHSRGKYMPGLGPVFIKQRKAAIVSSHERLGAPSRYLTVGIDPISIGNAANDAPALGKQELNARALAIRNIIIPLRIPNEGQRERTVLSLRLSKDRIARRILRIGRLGGLRRRGCIAADRLYRHGALTAYMQERNHAYRQSDHRDDRGAGESGPLERGGSFLLTEARFLCGERTPFGGARLLSGYAAFDKLFIHVRYGVVHFSARHFRIPPSRISQAASPSSKGGCGPDFRPCRDPVRSPKSFP